MTNETFPRASTLFPANNKQCPAMFKSQYGSSFLSAAVSRNQQAALMRGPCFNTGEDHSNTKTGGNTHMLMVTRGYDQCKNVLQS